MVRKIQQNIITAESDIVSILFVTRDKILETLSINLPVNRTAKFFNLQQAYT